MKGHIVSLSAALVLASAASASAPDDFARKGFYVGLGGTYAIDTFENELEDEIGDALGGRPSRRHKDEQRCASREARKERHANLPLHVNSPQSRPMVRKAKFVLAH